MKRSPIADQIWADKYRHTTHEGEHIDETITHTFERVALALSVNETDATWADRFYDLMSDFRFIPGGRILAGAGTGRDVTLQNCYVSPVIEDSMAGIFAAVQSAALTLQSGGGIGMDFSTIRPKGSKVVGVDSDASGPLSFMSVWDSMCKTVMSAGGRRGAMMAVLRCDHPDVMAFIAAKGDPTALRNFNMSVAVTDELMDAVADDATFDLVFDGKHYDTVLASDLWDAIMRSTYAHAEPGVMFIDRINERNNLVYCEELAATNPCLHPDSMVETINGRVRIADITSPTKVYAMDDDGKLVIADASASWVSKRGAETLTITLRTGKSLTCTPDHMIHTDDGWCRAQDLAIGDKVTALCRARRGAAYSGVKLTTQANREYVMEHRLVADAMYDLLETDAVHHINSDTYDNRIDNLEVMDHAEHSRHTALYEHPQEHQVTGADGKFIATGVSPNTIVPMPDDMRSAMKSGSSNCVMSIERGPRTDVYDLSVPGLHNFVADFMVVHNCGEVPLPAHGACLLGSMNLTQYINAPFSAMPEFDRVRFKADVAVAIRMMDNVVDVSAYPHAEQRATAQDKRRLGLGMTGLASALTMMGERYDTASGRETAARWTFDLKVAAYWASMELARERGSFPAFDKAGFMASWNVKSLPLALQQSIGAHGIRNGHLTSIAPTGTISLFADNVSSGVEPIFATSYTRKVLERDGSKRDEVVSDYAVRRYRNGLDVRLPDTFVTAQDISPEAHVLMQAAVQQHVDTAISKTVNLPADISFDDFKAVYRLAYDNGCKGCTTYRPNAVTGSVLSVEPTPAADVPVAASHEPAGRPDVLTGSTTKVSWPGSVHAYYVTVNVDQDGRPFELFVTSKNVDGADLMVGMTRMVSAVMRRAGDLAFVVEELKAVADPKGGQWYNGRLVPSLLHVIGSILEPHVTGEVAAPAVKTEGAACPACGEHTLVQKDGCATCLSCGHSACG